MTAKNKAGCISAFFRRDGEGHDFYAETLLALLMEEEVVTWDDLIIRTPQGAFQRSYRKDVVGIRTVQKEQQERVYIDLSRDGLYDILPEGLFHQTQIDKRTISTEDSVAEIKRHRQEEKQARKFFLPLEQEFYRQRMLIAAEELHAQISPENAALHKLYLKFWNIATPLTPYQATVMLYLLPVAHFVAGNRLLTQQCFSLVLEHPVTINFVSSTSDDALKVDVPLLGETVLGKSFILGDTLEATYTAIALTLGPIPGHQLPDYLPGAKGITLVELLSGYLLPASSEVVMDVQVEEADAPFVLGAANEQGRLGYTAVI